MPELSGVVRVLAIATIATVGLIWVHVLPGVFGVLDRAVVPVVALGFAAVSLLVPAAPDNRTGYAPAPAASTGFERVTAAILGACVLAVSLAYMRQQLATPTDGIDALTIHLPDVGAWIQSGSFWHINQFVPDLAHGYYPNNGDVVLLSAVLPWHDDAFVRLALVPFAGLLAAAMYAIATELSAPRAVAAVFAATACAAPALLTPTLRDVMPDVVCLFGIAAGVLFMCRQAKSEDRAQLVLAGLALGIAFGAKWYGVSSVVAIAVVWGAATLAARRPIGAVIRRGLELGGAIAFAGGFWLLRNIVASGNPFFPAKVSLLGHTIFDAPFDTVRAKAGFTIADYAGDGRVIGDQILPGIEHALGWIPILVPAAGVAAVLFLWRRRTGAATDGRLAALSIGALLLGALYIVTPDSAAGPVGTAGLTSANARYLLPAICLAAPALAGGVALCPAWIRIGAVLAAAVVCLDALSHALPVSPTDAGTSLLLLAAVTGTAAICVPSSRRQMPRWALGLAPALALVAVVWLGYHEQQRFNATRYKGFDPVIDALVNAPGAEKVGLAGKWSLAGLSPVLPAFGDRYENRVSFIGPTRRGMLREFRGCRGFERALEAEQPDLLVIGRGFARLRRHLPQQRCARAAGLVPQTSSPRLLLYRARPTRGGASP